MKNLGMTKIEGKEIQNKNKKTLFAATFSALLANSPITNAIEGAHTFDINSDQPYSYLEINGPYGNNILVGETDENGRLLNVDKQNLIDQLQNFGYSDPENAPISIIVYPESGSVASIGEIPDYNMSISSASTLVEGTINGKWHGNIYDYMDANNLDINTPEDMQALITHLKQYISDLVGGINATYNLEDINNDGIITNYDLLHSPTSHTELNAKLETSGYNNEIINGTEIGKEIIEEEIIAGLNPPTNTVNTVFTSTNSEIQSLYTDINTDIETNGEDPRLLEMLIELEIINKDIQRLELAKELVGLIDSGNLYIVDNSLILDPDLQTNIDILQQNIWDYEGESNWYTEQIEIMQAYVDDTTNSGNIATLEEYNIDIVAFAEYRTVADNNLASATTEFDYLNSLKTQDLGRYEQLGGDISILSTQTVYDFDYELSELDYTVTGLTDEYNQLNNPIEPEPEIPTEPEIDLTELTTIIDQAIADTPVDTRLQDLTNEIKTLEAEILILQSSLNNTTDKEIIEARIIEINARLVLLQEEMRLEIEKTKALLLEADQLALTTTTEEFIDSVQELLAEVGDFLVSPAYAAEMTKLQALQAAKAKILEVEQEIANLVRTGSLSDLARIEDLEGELRSLIHDLEGDVARLKTTRDSELSTLNSIIRNKESYEESVTRYRQEAEAVEFLPNSDFPLQTGNYPEYNGVVVEEESYNGKTMQGILTLTNGTTFPGKIRMYVDGERVGGEFTVNSWHHRYNYKDPLSDLFKASLRFQYSAEKVLELESEIPLARTEYNTAEYNYSTENNLLNSKRNEYSNLQTEFTNKYQLTSPLPGSTYPNTFDGTVSSLYNHVYIQETLLLPKLRTNRDNLQTGIDEENGLLIEKQLEQEKLNVIEGTNVDTTVYLASVNNQLVQAQNDSNLELERQIESIRVGYIENPNDYRATPYITLNESRPISQIPGKIGEIEYTVFVDYNSNYSGNNLKYPLTVWTENIIGTKTYSSKKIKIYSSAELNDSSNIGVLNAFGEFVKKQHNLYNSGLDESVIDERLVDLELKNKCNEYAQKLFPTTGVGSLEGNLERQENYITECLANPNILEPELVGELIYTSSSELLEFGLDITGLQSVGKSWGSLSAFWISKIIDDPYLEQIAKDELNDNLGLVALELNPIRKFKKLNEFAKKFSILNPARKFNILKADSLIWKDYLPYRGSIKTNGKTGSKKEYYERDYTHNDIEFYDINGIHLGSLRPNTGLIYKKAVPGRNIKDKL